MCPKFFPCQQSSQYSNSLCECISIKKHFNSKNFQVQFFAILLNLGKLKKKILCDVYNYFLDVINCFPPGNLLDRICCLSEECSKLVIETYRRNVPDQDRHGAEHHEVSDRDERLVRFDGDQWYRLLLCM